ncbi:unnamed protein product, partial [Didymodactylos carnosus]
FIHLVDASEKYGDGQRMLVANEVIEKGEKIWWCTCGDDDEILSRDEILTLCVDYPHLKKFLYWYSYMIADDIYCIPKTYCEQRNNDECCLFNHSCEPNCGFDISDSNNIVALKTIQPGEELTYDYNFLETEPSLTRGMQCKCETKSCVGVLNFDRYRDPEFQEKYLMYMSPYVQQRIRELKSKWYSGKCFTRTTSDPKIHSLHALERIAAGEIVAKFSGPIAVESHFIQHSDVPTCFVNHKKEVIAFAALPYEAEITLNYNKVLS